MNKRIIFFDSFLILLVAIDQDLIFLFCSKNLFQQKKQQNQIYEKNREAYVHDEDPVD